MRYSLHRPYAPPVPHSGANKGKTVPVGGARGGIPASLGPIPEELIGVQAYILWERAGKPDGADFSGDARRLITESVSSGMTYEQVGSGIGDGS